MLTCYVSSVEIAKEIEVKKGRPGGNPDITKYSFKQKYEWDEPCTDLVAVRLPPSLKKELKSIDGWQEFTRQAIAKALEERNS